MNLPEAALSIVEQIMQAGGQAYLVGGALRDHILGRTVTDYDIATSLAPEKIEELFQHEKTYPTGKRFGTITVAAGGLSVEVTTFRKETGYSDSRHPDQVVFVSDIVQDLSRRDFTINAMAYNPFIQSGFIDPFRGREDLKRGMIRAVGCPRKRFEEDPLRMLRGIRFAAQLDFDLEEDTKNAITECKLLLNHVSRERVRDEVTKLLLSPHPDKGVLLLQATGVLPALLKTADVVSVLTEKEAHIIRDLPANLDYRLAALLYILFPPILTLQELQPVWLSRISSILQSLRLDRKSINHVVRLAMGYSCFCTMDITPYNMRKLIGELDQQDTRHILQWYKTAQSVYENTDIENKYITATHLLDVTLENREPVFLSDLAINGEDILKAGIGTKDGRLVGEALKLAYEWVLEDPGRNHTESLIRELKNRLLI